MKYSDLSKKAKKYVTDVHQYIRKYKIEQPVKSKSIELEFGIGGVTVREIVHYLRTEEKAPICSDAKGYFYARNKHEAIRTIRQLRSRIRQINEACCALENAEYPVETENQVGFGFKVERKKTFEWPD